MEVVYIVYAVLALLALVLNVTSIILKLKQIRNISKHVISEEHSLCLRINNILLALASVIALLGTLQTSIESEALCEIVGFSTLYMILVISWTPLITSIILYEKERYSLRMKSHHGLTPTIVLFIIGTTLVISAALVCVNYAPITEVDKERYLICLPVTFPDQLGSEYTKLMIALVWLGLISTWSCIGAWLAFVLRNQMSVRYITERQRSTKAAGLQVIVCLALWTVVIVILSVYYWEHVEHLLHAAIFCSLLYLIGHPTSCLIIYWLRGGDRELSSSLSRDMPRRLTEITPLTVNPDANTITFHGRWLGRFNEKVQAVIKVYGSDQRSKWLREAKAMAVLRKTEHPNIAKYLWVSTGRSIMFPKASLPEEYSRILDDTSSRMVCTPYYDGRTLREFLLHEANHISDTTLKYVALDIVSALVRLRQLHIAHNKLSSKTVFIQSNPRSSMVTAVVSGFEESEHITLDHHRHRNAVTTACQFQATRQLDSKFACDIRSYALLLLELISAWNRQNGQPLKIARNQEAKSRKDKSHSLRATPDAPNHRQEKRHTRRTPPKPTIPIRKLAFGEIKEERQSNLSQQRIVNGEEIAIETNDWEEVGGTVLKCSESYKQPTGVIIPPGVTEEGLPDYRRLLNHPIIGRQNSNSVCSTDSGYPKSLASSSTAHMRGEVHRPASFPGKPSVVNLLKMSRSKALPPANYRNAVAHVDTAELSHHTEGYQAYDCFNMVPQLSTPESVQKYRKARESLPSDIISESEDYDFEGELAFSDDEKTTSQSPDKESCSTLQLETHNVTLSELAERVTNDVSIFLKSRRNSNASTTSGGTTKSKIRTLSGDSVSESSEYSNNTFFSAVERPLELMLDRELYLDKVMSKKHEKNGYSRSDTRRFLYRSGIAKTQLYYSKELASMYDMINPQLLYVNGKTTREIFKQYRMKLKVPTITQLLTVSETCWLEEPVYSAEVILAQLRAVFTITQRSAL